LKHEGRRHDLLFASLQGDFGQEVVARHPELTTVDSMIWLEGSPPSEIVRLRSEAALQAAEYLGAWWRLARVGRLLPPAARDAAYNLIARHRHLLGGRLEVCVVPPPEARARFLD
jgi:predicted DCC family thiol-disulfide oxidoreductase YuxK